MDALDSLPTATPPPRGAPLAPVRGGGGFARALGVASGNVAEAASPAMSARDAPLRDGATGAPGSDTPAEIDTPEPEAPGAAEEVAAAATPFPSDMAYPVPPERPSLPATESLLPLPANDTAPLVPPMPASSNEAANPTVVDPAAPACGTTAQASPPGTPSLQPAAPSPGLTAPSEPTIANRRSPVPDGAAPAEPATAGDTAATAPSAHRTAAPPTSDDGAEGKASAGASHHPATDIPIPNASPAPAPANDAASLAATPATAAPQPAGPAMALPPPPSNPPTAAPLPAEAPATPRFTPHLAPVQQVAPMAIALALGGGRNGRIAVSLDPVELGRVEITVERMHDTAVVQVSAERPETLALLARDGATLDRALGGAGIGSEGGRSLSFSLLGEGSGQGAGQGSGQGTEGGSHRGHHGRHGRHGPQGMPLDDTAPQRRALLGLLDVAI